MNDDIKKSELNCKASEELEDEVTIELSKASLEETDIEDLLDESS